jgi:hypothetical protein
VPGSAGGPWRPLLQATAHDDSSPIEIDATGLHGLERAFDGCLLRLPRRDQIRIRPDCSSLLADAAGLHQKTKGEIPVRAFVKLRRLVLFCAEVANWIGASVRRQWAGGQPSFFRRDETECAPIQLLVTAGDACDQAIAHDSDRWHRNGGCFGLCKPKPYVL